MLKPLSLNGISWTMRHGCLGTHGSCEPVQSRLSTMEHVGCKPDELAYLPIVVISGHPSAVETGATHSGTCLRLNLGGWLRRLSADDHWVHAASSAPLGGARSIH